MANLTSVLNQLEQEHSRLTSQLESLNNALSALNGTQGNDVGAGRARMSAAQRARWAKVRGKKVVSITVRRTMSPVARKKVAAAQRARWAKWRKAQKRG